MRWACISLSSAMLIASVIMLSGCGVTALNCSPDDDPCIQSMVNTPIGFSRDGETGALTRGPTIDQLAVLSQYRYPVRFDPSKARHIAHDDALSYLNKAVSAADRPYALCSYTDDSVLFAYVAQPIPFADVQIIPAHARVLNQENYVIFARYTPGTALLFNSVACIAYRRVPASGADTTFIPNEMEAVTEALLSVGAKLAD